MSKPEIAELLDALGFDRNSVIETIITTRDVNGSPSAAPMGVIRKGDDLLEIKPFKSSGTYRNLQEGRNACVNITESSGLFLATAFKDEDLKGFDGPRICEDLSIESSDASLLVELSQCKDASDERGSFIGRVISVRVHRAIPRAFSRGRAEAIEAIIHTTRIKVFLREKQGNKVEKLKKRFVECKNIVEGVSSQNSDENRVVATLECLIERWEGGARR